ncbi:cation:proton antiporter [Trichothermofontia sp.]
MGGARGSSSQSEFGTGQCDHRHLPYPPAQIIEEYESRFIILERIGGLGLLCLLFLTGLESDLDEMIRVGPQAATVAIVGVALPFLLGVLGLIYIFHAPAIVALFAGAALTATSIGITASVLKDLGQLSSREGQIIIGAAVLDDILGIVILAVVVALVKEGNVELSQITYLILNAIFFVGGALLLSRYGTPFFNDLAQKFQVESSPVMLGVMVIFIMAILAVGLRLEAALGAFAAGLAMGNTQLAKQLEEEMKPLVALFATIFFVLIDIEIDLSLFNPLEPSNWPGLLMATFLIIAAIAGKVAAGFSVFGSQPGNRLAIGTGMVPRGEVGLIFVGLGTSTGVLDAATDAALILMVITTTFLAPILLRLVFAEATSPASLESKPNTGG